MGRASFCGSKRHEPDVKVGTFNIFYLSVAPSLSFSPHSLFPSARRISIPCRRLSTSSTMTSTQTTVKPTLSNIGVYTNPAHDLWVAEAEPSLEQVQSGEKLAPGEVTVAVKSTGICG
jgi:hypothetical protein